MFFKISKLTKKYGLLETDNVFNKYNGQLCFCLDNMNEHINYTGSKPLWHPCELATVIDMLDDYSLDRIIHYIGRSEEAIKLKLKNVLEVDIDEK